MTTARRIVATLCVLGALAPWARAQQPPAAAGAKPPAAPASTPQQPAAAAQPAPAPAAAAYAYQSEGRRDPFVSLIGRGIDPKTMATRPSGLAGILIGELSVKGIMKDRSNFVAMVQGPDNKTYMVRSGDKLLDGSVKSIAADAVIFSQDVNDPLSVVKQRDITKKLRSTEEGRE